MASIVLGAAGAALGKATTLPFAAGIGSLLGKLAGHEIDKRLFSGDNSSSVSITTGYSENFIQTKTYGKSIPIIYGTARVAGNIIWSQKIKEVVKTSTYQSGGGGGKGGAPTVSSSTSEYSYFATFAIAICEGVIDDILRIFADEEVINPANYASDYRVYKGTEEQMPDHLIEAATGIGKVSAYRGLCYVVFEDLALADFGNRIPNFTFEVKRSVKPVDSEDDLENKISSVVMIPGSGEFVYDTIARSKANGYYLYGKWVQTGYAEKLNQHHYSGKANALVAIDNMVADLPNLEWVAVVVTWFGNSLDIKECEVFPAVEYKGNVNVSSGDWQVAGYNRANARQISKDDDGRPYYGGTPSDDSLIRMVRNLRERGKKIMLYPILMMDIKGKPWRGHLTGSSQDVEGFFQSRYNRFVLHYAKLLGQEVEAFVIGSEFKLLTAIKTGSDSFPAVDQLIALANAVRQEVAPNVTITYAADWSEYHHTNGGWYHLDKLWASDAIDVVGIDAYFPIAELAEDCHDVDILASGWQSGEGYDYIWQDGQKQQVEDKYAWKNIEYWWNNSHVNPDGQQTLWQPQMKPIWFTEYGFPSIDAAACQPNVFYDPESLDGGIPKGSNGFVDMMAQRAGLLATERYFKDSAMVTNKFVWCYDARPYPLWPVLEDVWADGRLYSKGHWLQGKLGFVTLGAVITDICQRVGLDNIEASHLKDQVVGFVVARPENAVDIINKLRLAYFFDVVEVDSMLKFLPISAEPVLSLSLDETVGQKNSDNYQYFTKSKKSSFSIPGKLSVVYMDQFADYKLGEQHVFNYQSSDKSGFKVIDLPVVMANGVARAVAYKIIDEAIKEQYVYKFILPYSHIELTIGDVVNVYNEVESHDIRITKLDYIENSLIAIEAVKSSAVIERRFAGNQLIKYDTGFNLPTNLLFEVLDLPAIIAQPQLHFAVSSLEVGFRGYSVYISLDGGDEYKPVISANSSSVMGVLMEDLADSKLISRWDLASKVKVSLYGDALLESKSKQAVLAGGNLCLLGDELLYFKDAKMLGDNIYELSCLLRGAFGTEGKMNHLAGERFVLLDDRVQKLAISQDYIGREALFKFVPNGKNILDVDGFSFKYQGVFYKTLPVVHVKYQDIGANQVRISWTRRPRINNSWRDFVDSPLAEEFEKYEVTIGNQQLFVDESHIVVSKDILVGSQVGVRQISPVVG